MDRTLFWDQNQSRTFDYVEGDHDVLYALANLTQDILGGTTTMISGLAASQTATPSLTINLAQGRIYQSAAADATANGAIPQDLTSIFQQGNAVAQTVTLSTTGIGAGQSRWSLVQAQFAQADSIRANDPNGGLLYFYNSANPSSPFEGPNNDGLTTPTVRQGLVSIGVITGAAATTGSEVPPSPTSGWVPLYLIDLTYGQTTIINSQILVAGPSVGTNVPSNYTQAPFLAGLLNEHHKGIAGYAPQIDLTAEVKNILPLTNLPASNTSGGGLSVTKLNAGNPNGSVAGNANVNGASDFCFDTTNKILYVCTTTGTTSTAVWVAAGSTGVADSFVAISTTGGTVSLTSAQSNTQVIELSGTLASNATVQLSSTSIKGQWLVWNNTSGAYTLTFGYASGTTVTVAQGSAITIYGDGTNTYGEGYAPLASPIFTGTPNAPTASFGTANTQIATTAFVNNAKYSFSGQTPAGTSATYTNSIAGQLILWYGSSGTLTMPLGSTVPAGECIAISSDNGTCTIVLQGSDQIYGGTTPYSSFVMYAGDCVIITSEGNGTWSFVVSTGQYSTTLKNLGIGGTAQAYTDVTASRAIGTTYTNSTNRPIHVNVEISTGASAGSYSATLTVAGNLADASGLYLYTGGTNTQLKLTGVVGIGETYVVTSSGTTLTKWYERR